MSPSGDIFLPCPFNFPSLNSPSSMCPSGDIFLPCFNLPSLNSPSFMYPLGDICLPCPFNFPSLNSPSCIHPSGDILLNEPKNKITLSFIASSYKSFNNLLQNSTILLSNTSNTKIIKINHFLYIKFIFCVL